MLRGPEYVIRRAGQEQPEVRRRIWSSPRPRPTSRRSATPTRRAAARHRAGGRLSGRPVMRSASRLRRPALGARLATVPPRAVHDDAARLRARVRRCRSEVAEPPLRMGVSQPGRRRLRALGFEPPTAWRCRTSSIRTSALRRWNDRPRPAGFGPIAAHWQPRAASRGTYDERWKRDRQPLLPDDFDDRFYQCAPRPAGAGVPAWRRAGGAASPHARAASCGSPAEGRSSGSTRASTTAAGDSIRTPRLHTVIIEPDFPRVSLVWHTRAPLPLTCATNWNERSPLKTDDSARLRRPDAESSQRGRSGMSGAAVVHRRPRRVDADRPDASGRARRRRAPASAGFSEHPFMIDTAGEPMRVAMAPWLDVGSTW